MTGRSRKHKKDGRHTDLNTGLCISLMAYGSPCELNRHSKNETFTKFPHSDDLKLTLIPSKTARCLFFDFDFVCFFFGGGGLYFPVTVELILHSLL